MNQQWLDKLIYGECPSCGEKGKDFSYLYRKLDEKSYWVTYRVCRRCGAPFGHKIEGDVGTDFWRHEQYERLSPLTDFLFDLKQNLQLAKRIVKKIKKGECVPADQFEMVVEFFKMHDTGGS